MPGVASTRRWPVWLFAAAAAVFVIDAAVESANSHYVYAARQLVGAGLFALLAVEKLRWQHHRPAALKPVTFALVAAFLVLLLIDAL